MKRLSMIMILFAIMLFVVKGEVAGVEIEGGGEAVLCTSTDPHIGANFILLNSAGTTHDFFSSAVYDSSYVEKNLALMQEWGMRYVRVFDGQLLSAENTFLSGVKNNILDFLNRANNHGITVFFTFTTVETWMYPLYNQRTGNTWVWGETEWNTTEGRRIYGDRIKYITQQCFASRSQNLVLSLRNEACFNLSWCSSMTTTQRRNLSVQWTNEMDAKVRSVDTRSNHKVAIGLMQGNADPGGLWTWHPPSIYGWTNIEMLDIHFYHLNGSMTWNQEFDSLYGWWAPYCTKDLVVGEIGQSMASTANGKTVAQNLLNLTHHIRNDSRYSKISDVMPWTLTPYYKTYDNGSSGPAPFHRLTDGYTGFTRVGVTFRYDQYVAEICSANYSTYSSYGTSNLTDYNDNTRCILMHVPSVSQPSNYEINFNGQWYRFHKIRIVDKTAPYPRDFKVYIYNGGWQLFGTVTGNTAQTVDVVTTASSGYMSGCKVKIAVTNEVGNWSSLHEIYINPVTILP